MTVGLGALAASCLIVASRHEGYPEREIVTRRGTHWLTYRPNGALVLADGISGRVMARLDTERANADLYLAQGSGGTFLVDPEAQSISFIDEADVELGGRRDLPESGEAGVGVDITTSTVGVGAEGMVIAPADGTDGFVVPNSGAIRMVPVGDDRRASLIGTDGAIWSLLGTGEIQRVLGSEREVFPKVALLEDTDFTVIGEQAVVLSRTGGELTWYPSGESEQIPDSWQAIDAVLQQPSEEGDCAWLGFNSRLLCIADDGVSNDIGLPDVQLGRADALHATQSTVVVQRVGGSLLNVDLTRGSTVVLPYTGNLRGTTVSSDASGAVWIDNPDTPQALVVLGNSVHSIDKLDERAPTFSPSGTPTLQELNGEGDAETLGTEPGGPPTVGSGIEPDNDAYNEPPVALDDRASGLGNQEVRVQVTYNDYDPDGDAVILMSTERPSNGVVEIIDSAVLIFRPRQGFVGNDSFTYTVRDPSGSTATATVTVTILKPGTPNLPPVTTADSRETAHARAIVIDVLANDADPEQAPLSLGEVTEPSSALGTVERTQLANGRPAVRFIPAETYAGGTVQFTYRAEDVAGALSSPTPVQVLVGAAADANRPPIAIGDAAQTAPGRPITIQVLANDRDPDNDELTIQRVDVDQDVGDAQASNGTIVFVPSQTATGTVAFRYVIADRFEETASATVVVQIIETSTNKPPVLAPDAYDAYVGGDQRLEVLGNDIDPEGDTLLLVDVSSPAVGEVDIVDGQVLRYRSPTTTNIAQTSFEYTVSDGNGNTAKATVTVRIRTVEQAGPPIAVSDNFRVPKNQATPLDLLKNDRGVSTGDLRLVGIPTCGHATCSVTSSGALLYTPDRDFVGTDEFTYVVMNGKGAQASASVLVTVFDPVEQAEPPTAIADVYTVQAGSTVPLTPLENDGGADPDALLIVNVTATTDGSSVQIARDGRSLTFTARNAPNTTSNFDYRIRDEANNESTGTVGVRIVAADAPPLPPVTGDDRGRLLVGQSADFDVLADDSDPDGSSNDLRLIAVRTDASGAAVSIVGRRFVRVTPPAAFAGELRVTYVVADAEGLEATGQLIVDVSEPPNAPPNANDDSATTPAGQPVTVTVLSNDEDLDGDVLTVELATPPSALAGVASVIDGRHVTFTPQAEFKGNVTFTYVAIDGRGLRSQPATVTIGVLPCAQSIPIVSDRLGEITPFDTPVTLDLLHPSQSEFIVTTQNVVGGVVSPGGRSGVVLFTPTSGSNGGGSFTYTVRNGCGISRSARVTLDINRSPRINVATAIHTEQDRPVEVDIYSIATDDEAITFQRADVGGVGLVEIIANGTRLRYTPPPEYRGAPELRVSVVDVGGLVSEATLRLVVNPPTNQPPVASDDTRGTSLVPGSSVAIEVLGNDIDPDGRPEDLRVQLMATTASINGVTVNLSVAADGRRIVVDVPDGVQGTGTFSYRAVDSLGARSEPAKVVVYANHAPRPLELAAVVVAGGSVQVDVLSSGNPDPDGDVVKIAGARSENSLVAVSQQSTVITVSADPAAAGTQAVILFSIVDSYGSWSVSRLVVDVVAAS